MGASRKKSKKPSGTKAEQLLESSTFFTNECLGHSVPTNLRASGLIVEFWDSHFKPGTLDVDWLPVVGENNWLVLTKDSAIRRKSGEMNRIMACGVRLFTLPNGNTTAEQMVQIFLENRWRMIHAALKNPGPFIATVYRDCVEIKSGGSKGD